ncbi:hypothetical protein F383_29078 [Gossypium arboreum]|uniref:Uncharacterized protein n=1 Tax=Gossypium arboreum TaxID=29729 RepID=A0A0B0MS46_GOSAR|nr:hypothetical protein F383_29078 [Gossypium arboreum]
MHNSISFHTILNLHVIFLICLTNVPIHTTCYINIFSHIKPHLFIQWHYLLNIQFMST